MKFRLRLKKVGKTDRPFRYDLNQIPYDFTVEVRNRFKGLDLIDRVPDELWDEVRDTVQETGIKIIPMEKKCKKAKWLSGEALQKAVKRREVNSKGENERYKHLSAEFQRIARRDKKAFLNNQCKDIEENNKIKTRDLFKKIRDTKGTFHSKMGTIKNRNNVDLIEAEYIKKRCRVRLFATPWTVAHQALPSMGFSRQEYWSGLPFPSPGDLPNPEIKPGSPTL